MTYLVYKHTSPSGKSYIGITKNYNNRCWHHQRPTSGCVIFRNAIQKYGWDAFHHEVLISNLSLSEANHHETVLIEQHNTLIPNGYNVDKGGKHSEKSEETKRKISIANKGKTHTVSAEGRAKMSAAKRGTKISDEGKQLRRELKQGTTLSDETKAKIAAKKKGVPKKQDTCVHCGLTASYVNINRWHNDHCKHRVILLQGR